MEQSVMSPVDRVVSAEFRAMLVENRSLIKRLLLTDRQVKLLDLVKERRCVSAPEIAKLLDISLQNASRQLTVLWEKTYLQREDVGDPTGGSMYQYFLRD